MLLSCFHLAMSTLSAISLSGMNAAQTALDTSAHNIANLSTAGFRREQVTQSTAANGGVTTSLSQSTHEGAAHEADVVGQLVAKNQFLANLAVFKTSDQMMGALLDATS
jgi:flagellar hook protein FlgE